MKILIDAGHYKNYNQSKVFTKYYEGNAMFYLQFLLKEELEKYGFTVKLTRTTNTDLSLAERGKMAKGYDVFLSLHSNACDTESVNRVVVIKGYDAKSTLGEEIALALTNLMGTQKQQVIKKTNSSGTDYYGVLRSAKSVGCIERFIVEHSFHTNKKMAQYLYEESNLKKIAKSTADTLAKHFGKTNYQQPFLIRVKEDVNYRWKADFSKDEYVKGVAKKGEVFTVVERVKSNCSTDMYRLKSGYYITTASKYVEVYK